MSTRTTPRARAGRATTKPGVRLRTYATVEVATVHITAADADLLAKCAREHDGPVIAYDREVGWFVHCGDLHREPDRIDTLRASGFSADFQRILLAASRTGARFIDFDRDAVATPGLATFAR